MEVDKRIINSIIAQFRKRHLAYEAVEDMRTVNLISEVSRLIIESISNGGKVITFGNGGSAAQSQHFCAELMGRMKESRLPIAAISLSSDISTTTCIANDFGYEKIFSRQIAGIYKDDDIAVAFTTSGKSKNILEALNECQIRGIKSVVITGGNKEVLQTLSDFVICIPNDDIGIIQEMQMQIIHILCRLIEKGLPQIKETVWEKLLAYVNKDYDALILDRDGVINKIKANGYVSSMSEFDFTDGFLGNIKDISALFKYIFVVSNQKGVGLGLMSNNDLEIIHDKMIREVNNHGGRITKIYVSTGIDSSDDNRKPNTGMAKQIKNDFPDVDFAKSIVIGDSCTDKLFAQNIGSNFFHVNTQ